MPARQRNADTRELTALSRTLAGTETLQLAEIHTLDAFYTPIEERFERLTRIGRCALKAPVIAITVITQDTQWFKSVLGWNVTELPLSKSLCFRVASTGKAAMVPNMTKHPRYANHPLVTKNPHFRSYYGIPLRNARGTVIGTFCVISRKKRKLRDTDVQILLDLAALAEKELLTVALHSAQTELLSKLSIARRQAMIDPLTKTWNRRGGMMLINELLEHAKGENKSIAMLAVDIDDFKKVNDDYGHAAGDKALRMVARQLLACTREGDSVCRIGGDEFIVVMPSVVQEDAERIARRIQDKIKRRQVSSRADRSYAVSVSVGLVHVEPGQATTAEDLLAQADLELYHNKGHRQRRVNAV